MKDLIRRPDPKLIKSRGKFLARLPEYKYEEIMQRSRAEIDAKEREIGAHMKKRGWI